MKSTPIALILALAISGASAWSCSKSSTPAADDKSASAPAPAPAAASAKPADPKPAAPVASAMMASTSMAKPAPAMPAASAVPAAAPKPAAPTGPDPRTDWKTAMTEATRVLTAKDYSGFVKEFMPPSAAAPGMSVDQMAAMMAAIPGASDSLVQLLQALQQVKDQTPTIDPSGNKVTFTLNPPIGDNKDVTFVKENGLWYLGD